MNVRELMEQIRARVREELAQHGGAPTREFTPRRAEDGGSSVKAGDVLHSEELLYLNRNFHFPSLVRPEGIVTHRQSLVGRFIVKLKRKVAAILRDSLLREYLDAQSQYQVHLVRLLNNMARYVDQRDSDNFWELIRKIDYDVGKALERGERTREDLSSDLRNMERSVHHSIAESVEALNRSIGQALAGSSSHEARLQTVEGVVSGLEGIIATLTRSQNAYAESGAKELSTQVQDQRYRLLENRFRGSEQAIASRMAPYVGLFKAAVAPVLEVGCGRGELLSLFREAGISATGLDLDGAMVERCREKGLECAQGDVNEFLSRADDQSFGGIIAIQVVEHLPLPVLSKFLELSSRKVKPGGLIVLETINPTSMLALSSNYFRDPTHVFPQHPDTLAYACTLANLRVRETRYLSPIPEEAKLRELGEGEFMTPHWSSMVRLFNHNIRALNSLLFGAQDYCVIAEVR